MSSPTASLGTNHTRSSSSSSASSNKDIIREKKWLARRRICEPNSLLFPLLPFLLLTCCSFCRCCFAAANLSDTLITFCRNGHPCSNIKLTAPCLVHRTSGSRRRSISSSRNILNSNTIYCCNISRTCNSDRAVTKGPHITRSHYCTSCRPPRAAFLHRSCPLCIHSLSDAPSCYSLSFLAFSRVRRPEVVVTDTALGDVLYVSTAFRKIFIHSSSTSLAVAGIVSQRPLPSKCCTTCGSVRDAAAHKNCSSVNSRATSGTNYETAIIGKRTNFVSAFPSSGSCVSTSSRRVATTTGLSAQRQENTVLSWAVHTPGAGRAARVAAATTAAASKAKAAATPVGVDHIRLGSLSSTAAGWREVGVGVLAPVRPRRQRDIIMTSVVKAQTITAKAAKTKAAQNTAATSTAAAEVREEMQQGCTQQHVGKRQRATVSSAPATHSLFHSAANENTGDSAIPAVAALSRRVTATVRDSFTTAAPEPAYLSSGVQAATAAAALPSAAASAHLAAAAGFPECQARTPFVLKRKTVAASVSSTAEKNRCASTKNQCTRIPLAATSTTASTAPAPAATATPAAPARKSTAAANSAYTEKQGDGPQATDEPSKHSGLQHTQGLRKKPEQRRERHSHQQQHHGEQGNLCWHGDYRIGLGTDLHRLTRDPAVATGPLILGGVVVSYPSPTGATMDLPSCYLSRCSRVLSRFSSSMVTFFHQQLHRARASLFGKVVYGDRHTRPAAPIHSLPYHQQRQHGRDGREDDSKPLQHPCEEKPPQQQHQPYCLGPEAQEQQQQPLLEKMKQQHQQQEDAMQTEVEGTELSQHHGGSEVYTRKQLKDATTPLFTHASGKHDDAAATDAIDEASKRGRETEENNKGELVPQAFAALATAAAAASHCYSCVFAVLRHIVLKSLSAVLLRKLLSLCAPPEAAAEAAREAASALFRFPHLHERVASKSSNASVAESLTAAPTGASTPRNRHRTPAAGASVFASASAAAGASCTGAAAPAAVVTSASDPPAATGPPKLDVCTCAYPPATPAAAAVLTDASTRCSLHSSYSPHSTSSSSVILKSTRLSCREGSSQEESLAAVPAVGVIAHSDGDAVLHAICDALLGARAAGDIGQHFPDTDPQFRGADSALFLSRIAAETRRDGWDIANVDVSVHLEAVKLGKRRKLRMRENIVRLLQLDQQLLRQHQNSVSPLVEEQQEQRSYTPHKRDVWQGDCYEPKEGQQPDEIDDKETENEQTRVVQGELQHTKIQPLGRQQQQQRHINEQQAKGEYAEEIIEMHARTQMDATMSHTPAETTTSAAAASAAIEAQRIEQNEVRMNNIHVRACDVGDRGGDGEPKKEDKSVNDATTTVERRDAFLAALQRVNIKAKTGEQVGVVGKCQAVECFAVVMLKKKQTTACGQPP